MQNSIDTFSLLTGKRDRIIRRGGYSIYLHRPLNGIDFYIYIHSTKPNETYMYTDHIEMKGTMNEYEDYINVVLNETIRAQETSIIYIPDNLYAKHMLDLIKYVDFNQ